MPAELGLNRVADPVDVHILNDVRELGDHLLWLEPAKLTAGRAGRAGGVGLGEVGEIAAVLQLGHQILRLFLGLDQDMARVVLGRGLGTAVLLFVGSLDLFFGHGFSGLGFDHLGGQQRTTLVLQDQLVGGGQVVRLGAEGDLLRQLLEDPVEEGLVVQLLILLGQAAPHGDHVAQRDLGFADGGDHGRGVLSGGGQGRGGQKAGGGQRAKSGHRADHVSRHGVSFPAPAGGQR